MNKILVCLSMLLIAACGKMANDPPMGVDQCMRAELFKACMAALPKGPERIAAAGNDWDEVVDSCENAAYYQSIRPLSPKTSPGCWIPR